MSNRQTIADDGFFENLVDRQEQDATAPAPARLKAKLYSALLQRSQEDTSLRALSDTRRAGYELCLWEKAMQVVPGVGRLNHCRFCHARLLGESFEHAPLGWAGCPYAQFHRR